MIHWIKSNILPIKARFHCRLDIMYLNVATGIKKINDAEPANMVDQRKVRMVVRMVNS